MVMILREPLPAQKRGKPPAIGGDRRGPSKLGDGAVSTHILLGQPRRYDQILPETEIGLTP